MSGLNNYIIVVKWFEFQTKWGVVRSRKQWCEMKFQLNCNLSNRFDRLYSQKGQFSHSTGFLWAPLPAWWKAFSSVSLLLSCTFLLPPLSLPCTWECRFKKAVMSSLQVIWRHHRYIYNKGKHVHTIEYVLEHLYLMRKHIMVWEKWLKQSFEATGHSIKMAKLLS